MSAQRIPVLMYHRVGQPYNHWEQSYCIHSRRFSAHLHALASNGYRTCSSEEFIGWVQNRRELPEKTILITFDDGYAGVYEHAMPTLMKYGWSATVFLVAGSIGGQDEWCQSKNHEGATYPLLNRAQIEVMRHNGFSFHSHSHSHADLAALNATEIERELQSSKQELEQLLGGNVCFLAFPFGRFNDQVVEKTRQAGYIAAFSTRSGFSHVGDDPFRIRRIEVCGTDTPRQLLRKVQLGTNDGSLGALIAYYRKRLLNR